MKLVGAVIGDTKGWMRFSGLFSRIDSVVTVHKLVSIFGSKKTKLTLHPYRTGVFFLQKHSNAAMFTPPCKKFQKNVIYYLLAVRPCPKLLEKHIQ
jgi:hypothetical protein